MLPPLPRRRVDRAPRTGIAGAEQVRVDIPQRGAVDAFERRLHEVGVGDVRHCLRATRIAQPFVSRGETRAPLQASQESAS